ncbi:unnamed protein product, partial [Symbiodinium pilosum]
RGGCRCQRRLRFLVACGTGHACEEALQAQVQGSVREALHRGRGTFAVGDCGEGD